MAHDATKVLMGMARSSFVIAEPKVGALEAGLVVRHKSDGTITTAIADGPNQGVSLGKDLSDAGRTSICRAGLKVPVLLTAAFVPTLGAAVHISDTTGKAIAAGAGATITKAVYASAKLTAVKEDGTVDSTDGCALIDMQGGL